MCDVAGMSLETTQEKRGEKEGGMRERRGRKEREERRKRRKVR